MLGALLSRRRAGEAHSVWSMANLQAPEVVSLQSSQFVDFGRLPLVHAGGRIGGSDLSPQLSWRGIPDGASELLLVVEDLDSPTKRPFVHCIASLDPSHLGVANSLSAGDLSQNKAVSGVRLFRSSIGTGYRGPGPMKGHGPHRYVFELFALSSETGLGQSLANARPYKVLEAIGRPVLARGKITGIFER